jgi:trigger factor
MQVSISKEQGLERELSITLPIEPIDERIQQRLKEVSRTADLPGFRAGKVPFSLVEKRYGAAITEEILEEVIKNSVFNAIDQEKFKLAGMPSITARDYQPGKSFNYTIHFEVLPEVELKPLTDVTITRYTAQVSDEQVNETLTQLQKQRAVYEKVERPAAQHDQVTIDFIGTREGVAFEGGTGTDYPLVLGSGSMIPGFEEGIIGLSVNESKEVPLTFPEAYHHPDLAGKETSFKITVKAVSEPKLPELTDEFVKEFQVEGGVEGLRNEIRKNLAQQLKTKEEQLVRDQLIEKLVEKNSVDIPRSLVKSEIHEMQTRMLQQFPKADREKYRAMLSEAMFEQEATRRVHVGLLFSELIKQFNITVDEERMAARMSEIADTYERPEEMIKYFKTDDKQRQKIESQVLEEQVFDKLLEQVKTVEQSMPFQELMAFKLQDGEDASE